MAITGARSAGAVAFGGCGCRHGRDSSCQPDPATAGFPRSQSL